MGIAIRCEQCGADYRVRDELAGKRVQCIKCGAAITVTRPESAPIAAQPAATRPAAARPAAPKTASAPAAKPHDPLPGLLQEAVARPTIAAPTATAAPPGTHARPAETSRLAVGTRYVLLGGVAIVVCVVATMVVKTAIDAFSSSDTTSPVAKTGGPYKLADISPPPATFAAPRKIASPAGATNVDLSEVTLSGGGGPGQRGKLWVYLPQGSHADRSLPCILVPPAGSPLICGMALGDGDQAEHVPYAQAGFAVVAFELDGPVRDIDVATERELRGAYAAFSAAGAGIVNARNAFRYATTKIPAVDPKQVYIAGHSSAGTLSLLFAEHEPGLAGCIAYAPCSDVRERLAPASVRLEAILPGSADFGRETSPLTHVDRLKVPTFLFHANDDDNVRVFQSQRFADELRGRGCDVTFVTTARGGHYDAMINEGIGRAIQWVRARRSGGAPPRPPLAGPTTPPGVPPRPPVMPPALPPVAPPASDANLDDDANPFANRPHLRGLVRFQMLGYTGAGDPQAAAEQALRRTPWIDPTCIKVDAEKKTIYAGVVIQSLNTGTAKRSLEAAGFQIGSTMFKGTRRP